MRAVADTNVVVSAFLWGGVPKQLLGAARSQRLDLYTSAALVAELEEILARAKFEQRLDRAGSSVKQILSDYLILARLVRVGEAPAIVHADPDDDQVLACATAARAELIVSGDRHLLELSEYQDIPIVTPAEALRRLPLR